MRAPAVRPRPAPDLSQPITALGMLLDREEEARTAHHLALSAFQRAQAAVKKAEREREDRSTDGIDAVAASIAAVAAAKEQLTSAAVEAAGTRDRLKLLSGEVNTSWTSLIEQAQPLLSSAEAEAETDFCVAAAALAGARIKLNEIRAALGTPLIPSLHIRAPGASDRNAAEVATHFSTDLPHVEDLGRLRVQIESRRGRNT